MQSAGKQCGDLSGDRSLGAAWENRFCDLLPFGCTFIRHQEDRTTAARYTVIQVGGFPESHALPDVTVHWRNGEHSHHEIKHKSATAYDSFSLEKYRFSGLCKFARATGQLVHYTIHDHGFVGDRMSDVNDVGHWLTASVLDLEKDYDGEGKSKTYCDSIVREGVPCWYWSRARFKALAEAFPIVAYPPK